MKNIVFLSARLLGLAAGLVLATLAPVRAQAPATTGPTPQADPTAVPLDGGASLLLAAGVGLGLRRLSQLRRRPTALDVPDANT